MLTISYKIEMQLAYIWIKEYGKIKEQNVNLGSPLLFEYDKEKNLNISADNKYIPNLYKTSNNDRIINISCIVGENGSGKSTIIDYLFNFDYNFSSSPGFKSKYQPQNNEKIIIFLDTANKFIHIYISNANLINSINRNNMTESKFTLQQHIIGDPVFIDNDIIAIYFSNVFDTTYRYIHNPMTKYDISLAWFLSNVSNNNRVYNSAEGDNPTNKRMFLDRYDINPLKKYNAELTKMILKFLSDKELNKHIEFKVPDKISIQLDFFSSLTNKPFKKDYAKGKSRLFWNNVKDISNIELAIRRIIDNTDLKKGDYGIIFLKKIIAEMFTAIEVNLFNNKKISKERIHKLLNENKSEYADVKEAVTHYKNTITDIFNKTHHEIDTIILDDITNKFLNFYDIFIDFINRTRVEKVESYSLEGKSYALPIYDISDVMDFERFSKFLDAYYNLPAFSEFLIFEWRGISSGEEAFLSTIARFYFVKEYIDKKEIIILLDECELYMHPEWQRKNLNTLVKTINYIYSKAKSIQIILASNSPFILSDLPLDNVIFVKNGKVESNESKKQTFAANIFELLREDFFMTSTIGEFAKERIKKITEKISNVEAGIIDDISQTDKQLIRIIGEPYLKNLIIERYRKVVKNNASIDVIDDKIKKLTEEKEEALLGKLNVKDQE